jgi:hypothetical protein
VRRIAVAQNEEFARFTLNGGLSVLHLILPAQDYEPRSLGGNRRKITGGMLSALYRYDRPVISFSDLTDFVGWPSYIFRPQPVLQTCSISFQRLVAMHRIQWGRG